MSEQTRRQFVGSAAMAGVAPFALVPAIAAPSKLRLKITRVETIPVRVPFHPRLGEDLINSYRTDNKEEPEYRTTIVRLHTNAGLVGVSEARLGGTELQAVTRRMVGRSPWDFAYDDSLGGLLIGVYDLMAQSADVPIGRLLSPRPVQRIRPAWWSHSLRPALLQSEARLAADRGYRLHKVESRLWEDPLEQAAAISDAVPHEYRIWFDPDGTWGSAGRTLHFSQVLSKQPTVFALETPIPTVNVEAYRQLRGNAGLRIADTLAGLRALPYLKESIVDTFVFNQSLGRSLLDNASLAEFFGVRMWVESELSTGLAQVFLAHQASAYPAIELIVSRVNTLEDDLMKEALLLQDGWYEVPRRAGLGASIDEHAVEKYRIG